MVQKDARYNMNCIRCGIESYPQMKLVKKRDFKQMAFCKDCFKKIGGDYLPWMSTNSFYAHEYEVIFVEQLTNDSHYIGNKVVLFETLNEFEEAFREILDREDKC